MMWAISNMQLLRVAAIAITVFSLLASLMGGWWMIVLPDDPHHISRKVAAYMALGIMMGIFGVRGLWMNKAQMISSFSNFLLIDTVFSCVLRLGALYALRVWALDSLPSQEAIPRMANASAWDDLKALVTCTSERRFSLLDEKDRSEECVTQIKAAFMAAGAAVLATLVLQFAGACVVKAYARELKRTQMQRRIQLGNVDDNEKVDYFAE